MLVQKCHYRTSGVKTKTSHFDEEQNFLSTATVDDGSIYFFSLPSWSRDGRKVVTVASLLAYNIN